MKFTELWSTLEKRNQKLLDPEAKVTITSYQFRKALRQAYEQGEKAATERAAGNPMFERGGFADRFFGR